MLKIYVSNNYGRKLIRIWTNDFISTELTILNPIMFADTGHIAFIYRLNEKSSCCYYFTVFSKTGNSRFFCVIKDDSSK